MVKYKKAEMIHETEELLEMKKEILDLWNISGIAIILFYEGQK